MSLFKTFVRLIGDTREQNRVNVWVVTNNKASYSSIFDDIALGLLSALKRSGFEAQITCKPSRSENLTIILNTFQLLQYRGRIGKNVILFNLEQIASDASQRQAAYISLLRKSNVWDYSPKNVSTLRKLGIDAQLCQIGYVPELTKFEPDEEQDIDVAFIGSINARRQYVLDKIKESGLNLFWSSDIYGANRDRILARSKIILCMHYYDEKIFPMVRIQHLLANRCCVLCESGSDTALERHFSHAVHFCEYDALLIECNALVFNAPRRKEIANRGFDIFSGMSQVAYVKSALALRR